jgi:hypothetical protein
MKINLPILSICTVLLLLVSCSRRYYTTSDFHEKTLGHKAVAILPAEIILTGKLPKNMSPEDVARAEETESIRFQYALHNNLLRHANTRKYITTVHFQDINTTRKLLEGHSISVRECWKMDDNDLARLLGVDAVIRMRIEKRRYMSDEASYGIEVAKQVIHQSGAGSKIPVPASAGKTFDIYASCNLISNNQILWNDHYKRAADWDTPDHVVIEWITGEFGQHFPYKKKRNRR